MYSILLIDDEESILRVLSISLKSENYKVFTALNGEAGLDLFKKENPDIVLTDIKMPGMNGIDVLKKIKEFDTDTEVILITGHGEMETAIEALQNGASDFINKPLKDEALTVALDRAREKIEIRKQLREYSEDLENMVKIATEEIRRKTKFQTKLLRSSDQGIVATDETGKTVLFNLKAQELFGYKYFEVRKKDSLFELFPADLACELEMGLGGYQEYKELSNREIEIVSKSGEIIPVIFSGLILYEGKEVMGSVAFLQDLREIKRLERELIKSERLAAIGQTIAGLAHYIKNILAGLKGGSYILDVGFRKKNLDKISEGWRMIQKNIDRISTLVLDFLSYSKEREPQYENIDLNNISQEVFDLLFEQAKKNNIILKKNFDLSIGEISIDAKIIHRAILDLVSNAIDACIFDEDFSKKHVVELKTKKDKDNIIIEVKDNGCGMTDEVKSHIFSSFFSTKKGKGTGLGLLITKKSIEEHKGTINFHSFPGKGSSFFIKLSNR
ncbi:MAG: response regulator [Spirochaetes bacterium]|nr:response regulator [Spirochaetota bacterium]